MIRIIQNRMIEDHKRTVRELFDRFNRNDIDGFLSLLTDDVDWWLAGKTDVLRTSGTYDKKRLRKLLHGLNAAIKGGLRFTLRSMMGEADQVAAEASSSGDLDNGRQYRQEYFFLFHFRGSRIAAVREYFDTQHAFDVWLRP